MRQLPLLCTPPAFSVADEPMDPGAAGPAADAQVYANGFELVPAWQARPARSVRRLAVVAVGTVAVAVAVALAAGRGNDAQALRERTAAHRGTSAPASPLVVRAASPERGVARRSRR